MSDQSEPHEQDNGFWDEPVLESVPEKETPDLRETNGEAPDRPYVSRYDSYRFKSTPDPSYHYNGSGTPAGNRQQTGPVNPAPGRPGNSPDPENESRKGLTLAVCIIAGLLFLVVLFAVFIRPFRDAASGDGKESGTQEVHIGRQDDAGDAGDILSSEETAPNTAALEEDREKLPDEATVLMDNPFASSYSEDAESAVPETEETQDKDSGLMTAPQVIASALPSMAAITNVTVTEYEDWFGNIRKFEDVSFGSGIIVSKTDDLYLIATSYEVIASSEGITVTFLDKEESAVSAEIAGVDKASNLAIVSVRADDIPSAIREQIQVIRIDRTGKLRAGEPVVAIGNALGYGQSASKGILSAVNRVVTNADGTQHLVIQTDASINPGNNGGALLNMRGELIGINEVKEVDETVEGIGYAIPMSEAYPVLEKLGARSVREKVDPDEAAYLGIRCITMPESYTLSGYPAGAYVDEVVEGGAAEKAGIQRGDIIISIEGVDITSSDDVLEELSYHKGGESIEVTVARVSDNDEPGWESRPLTESVTLSVVPDSRSDMAS